MKIKKVEWFLAFRPRKEKLLFEDTESLSDFAVIKNSTRYWCADPFLIKKDNENYVFFEMYDRLKRKGCIGYRKIYDNGTVSKMNKIFEDDCHLSYPNIFRYNGDCFIIPESNQKEQLYLLRAKKFPDKWVKEKIICDNIKLADTTFLNHNSEIYTFTTPIKEDNVSCLSLCKIEDNELDIDKLSKPILKDKSRARMAGNFIKHGNGVIRVSQNCTNGYGSGLVFSKIKHLEETKYEEEKIASIEGDNLVIAAKKYDGIHTYNVNDDYEFIDLKVNEKFNLIETLGYARQKILSIFKSR